MKTKPLIQQINSFQFSQTQTTNISQSSPPQQKYQRQYKIFPMRGRKQKCIVCKKMCNYRCPKCNKNYCGIQHFKSHNLFCTQEFYEKQVTQNLKGLKIKDKNQKKKAVDMVKKYQQQIQQQIFNSELNVQRLEQILKIIEQGKQPNLTKKQQYLFQQYLSLLTTHPTNQQFKQTIPNTHKGQNQQTQPQIQTPYWQIQSGLSAYINKTMQIQQYQQTQNPQVVACRHLYSKQLQQFIAYHPAQQRNIKQIVNLHLLQIIYSFVTLYRIFDTEVEQFRNLFLYAYCSKENQGILKMDNVCLQDFIDVIEREMIKADCLINANGQGLGENVMRLWLNKYGQFIVSDITKIFKNKYLVIQTLLRIIQSVTIKNQNSENMSQNSTNNSEISKKSTTVQKMSKKIIKKCQYLLYMVVYKYSYQQYEPILNNLYKIKQKTIHQHNMTKKQKIFKIINQQNYHK